MEAELPMFNKGSWWLGRPGGTHGQVHALPLSSLPTWGQLQADSEGSFPTSPVSSLTRDGLVFVFSPRPSEADITQGSSESLLT